MNRNKYFIDFSNKNHIIPLKFNDLDRNLLKINNKYKK